MRSIILAVAFLFIASVSYAGTGGFLNTAVQDAALSYVTTNGTIWTFVTDISGPITYSQANTATGSGGRAVAKVTLSGGSGGYSAIGTGSVAGSRSINMTGVSGITSTLTSGKQLIGDGTATHFCILSGSAVIVCNPLATNQTVATTQTWDFAGLTHAVEVRGYTTP